MFPACACISPCMAQVSCHPLQVKGGRHFSAIQEDDKAPGPEQPIQRQAAPAKRATRLKRASATQGKDAKGEETPVEEGQIPAKRARRGAQLDTPRDIGAAAEPDQEQQPAGRRGRRGAHTERPQDTAAAKLEQEEELVAKKGKQASCKAAPQVEVSEPEQDAQPTARRGTRTSRAEAPPAMQADPKEADAPPGRRSKHAGISKKGSEATEQAQPHAAKAGKRAAAKSAQPDSEPPVGLKEEPGPSLAGGTHTAWLGKQSLHAPTQDRQLRAPVTRQVSACPLRAFIPAALP